MLWYFVAVVAGFALLVWGANRLILGASAMALNLGVPALIVGLTIVGFGTSTPEMLVSGVAAWFGNPGLAIGNALGSNIANIGLCLGVTAMVAPLNVNSDTLRREFPIMFAVMVLSLILMVDGSLDRPDGIVLLLGMVTIIYWMTRLGLRSREPDPMRAEYELEIPRTVPMGRAVLWFLIGLVTLLISSRMVVWGAAQIALQFGLTDLVVGLTVVALGTSLPELATSVAAVLKREHDIAVGNIVGSNMFNLLGVLGIPGLIHPYSFPAETLSRDYTVMFGLALALFALSFGFGGPGRITRIEGGALFLAYCGYLALLYFSATGG